MIHVAAARHGSPRRDRRVLIELLQVVRLTNLDLVCGLLDARAAWRQNDDVVHILFDQLAPLFKERVGGYTRIIKLGGTEGRWAGERRGDSAKMAIIEWVELPVEAAPEPAKADEKKAEAAK